MRVLEEIDVLGDEAFQRRLFLWSVGMLGATLVVAAAAGIASWADGGSMASPAWWVALAVGSFAALPVHELVHGAAFKLLCAPRRVSFGVQFPFLYTQTEGVCAPRPRMVAVLLAPAVLVTVALAAAALVTGLTTLAVLLAGVHLAGCAGDMLMAAAALRTRGCTHVRDTDVGIDLLSDKESQ